jgi:hypothetical protein
MVLGDGECRDRAGGAMKTAKEDKAKKEHKARVAAEEKWRFKATITKDVVIDGCTRQKKGEVLHPKGFYYNGLRDKWVILVGDVLTGHTIRMKVPRDSVNIEVRYGGEADA